MKFPNRFVVIAVISCFPIVVNGFPSLSKIFTDVTDYVDDFLEKRVFKTDPSREELLIMTTPEMIVKEGYEVESHEVMTSDGYALTLHRIPSKPQSTPVFIQHGLLGSSFDWVLPGKHKGLAFILADAGYDVWMGNSRGNTYSKKHTNFSTDSSEFWDFSWHEMGVYDLPAAINYVTNVTNYDGLIYIGFSQGTTQFFVMASEESEFAAEKIKASFILSPIVFMDHAVSPIRYLAPTIQRYAVKKFFEIYARGQLLPHASPSKVFGKYICNVNDYAQKICSNLFFGICGFDSTMFNYTLLPRILKNYPEGSSVYTIVHYGQEMRSGKFQKYDYGSSENLEKYHQSKPPSYDLSKVKVPVALFSAKNDWLSHPVDVQKLSDLLPNKLFDFIVEYPEFNHIDWMWGIKTPEMVYKKLITEMDKWKQ